MPPPVGFMRIDRRSSFMSAASYAPIPDSVVLVLCALLLLATDCSAVVYPVHGWDVYYNWATPSGATSNSKWLVDVTMEVDVDPGDDTYYYWSHFTFFTHKKAAAGATLIKDPGAYVGLQTNGNHKSIVFSAWNGITAIPDKSPAGVKINNITNTATSYCKPFGNDTSGYHCFYTYNWQAKTKYRFRMELASRSAWGDAIRGTMYNMHTQEETMLGEIFVPAFLGSPLCSVLFYEYFGFVEDCKDIPPASTTFSNLSLVLKTGTRSIPAAWTSVSSMLNGAGGGSCIGWATLDICNTTVIGTSPSSPPLTEAKSNRCGVGANPNFGPYRPVPMWEHQKGTAEGPLSRLPRLATYACLDKPPGTIAGICET